MVLRTFEIEKMDWEYFKRQVGDNNASATIRNFIKSFTDTVDFPEKKLRKEFEIVDEEYKKIKNKWERLKDKIQVIDDKRKQEELKKIKKEETLKKRVAELEHNTLKDELHRMI